MQANTVGQPIAIKRSLPVMEAPPGSVESAGAAQQSAYGYLLLHGILKAEGLVVNKKHTYRLYTEEGLQGRYAGRNGRSCSDPGNLRKYPRE